MSERPPTAEILAKLPRRSAPGSSGVLQVTPTPPPKRDPLAKPMFWLASLSLLFYAGLFHRAPGLLIQMRENPESIAIWEYRLILAGCAIVWALIVAEGLYRVIVLACHNKRTSELIRLGVVSFFPPCRMGWPSLIREGQIWLPGLRWREVNERLEEKISSRLRVPMIGFALLILPLLGLEFLNWYKFDHTSSVRTILDVGSAIIWIAFAVDFILGLSLSTKKMRYFMRHMLDFFIVVIPMFQFILSHLADAALLGRLLRLGRVSQLLSRSALLYQLRTLPLKAWQALVALELVQSLFRYLVMRLLGIDPLRRKRDKINEQIREIDRQRTNLLEERFDLDRRLAIRDGMKKEASA